MGDIHNPKLMTQYLPRAITHQSIHVDIHCRVHGFVNKGHIIQAVQLGGMCGSYIYAWDSFSASLNCFIIMPVTVVTFLK